jgi:hypothetical protein
VCIFFIFWPSKIHVSPTGVVSSIFPLRCRLFSGRHHHAITLCYASFILSQDKLVISVSSFDNALFHRLPSQAKIKALNSHHRRRLSSPDCPTPTLHYYIKIILILTTLPTTQHRLHFTSSLARALCHRNFTRRRHSLSPLSYVHHSSA